MNGVNQSIFQPMSPRLRLKMEEVFLTCDIRAMRQQAKINAEVNQSYQLLKAARRAIRIQIKQGDNN